MRKALALAAVLAVSLATSLAFSPVPVDEGYILSPGGTRLFYRIVGRGTDTVVVLHGGPGGHQGDIAPDVVKLLVRHRVLFYDQRGGGQSTLPQDGRELGMDDHVRDLDAVRRYFGLERMSVIGHEWGAALAARYATRHPERVANLLLISPLPVQGAQWQQYQQALDARLGSQLAHREALQQAIISGDDPEAACRELHTLLTQSLMGDATRAALLRGCSCSARPQAQRFAAEHTAPTAWRSLGSWDWRAELAAVTARTLVVHGAQDLMPQQSAQEWALAVPNARVLVLPGAGHYPHVEAADRFWADAEQFLGGGWPAEAQGAGRPVAAR